MVRPISVPNEPIQRTTSIHAPRTSSTTAPSRIRQLRGRGEPLSEGSRAFFEPRFGADLSAVRVHTGPQVDAIARDINAHAFTFGTDIAVRPDEYQPHTLDGRRLLAHELTHVLQQADASARRVQRKDDEGATGTSQQPVLPAKLAGVDPTLAQRVVEFTDYLAYNNVAFEITAGTRTRKKAHFNSTAYHIYNKMVPLGALRALPGGRDSDQSVWYKPEWEGRLQPDFVTWRSVTTHAFDEAKAADPDLVTTLFGGRVETGLSCAYEGYPAGDARRLPNIDEVPLSSHVEGEAVDIRMDWSTFGDSWSADADAIVADFGLTRPFREDAATHCVAEHWHFELPQ